MTHRGAVIVALALALTVWNGIFSWLVVKNAGNWKIRAVQNTGKN